MKRKLKVFGLDAFLDGKIQRCVVAAKSQREAADLMGTSLHYLRGYGSETHNEKEISDALDDPGKVLKGNTR